MTAAAGRPVQDVARAEEDSEQFREWTGQPAEPRYLPGTKVPEMLRAPFDSAQLSKRPEITCLTCRDPEAQCAEHEQQVCTECHQLLTTQHEHIEYVDINAVRERLLDVDPHWYWKPFALTAQGLPALDSDGVLWLYLFIHDEDGFLLPAKVGCGDAGGDLPPGQAAAARVSNALKNAAHQGGVALRESAKPRPVFPMVPGRPGLPVVAADSPVAPLVDMVRVLSGYANRYSNAEISLHYAQLNAEHPDEASRSINTAGERALVAYIAHLANDLTGAAEGDPAGG